MSTLNSKSMQVREVMLPLNKVPVMRGTALLKEALDQMGRFRLGIACLIDDEGRLIGILTDGDIRRNLVKVQKPISALFMDDAIDHAILKPVTVSPDEGLKGAVETMGSCQVWDLPVVTSDGRLTGLLHLHPAIKALLG